MTAADARANWNEVLRRLKAEHDTYAGIGKALGVHENSVQNWMTVGRLPDFRTVGQIAAQLKLDADALHGVLDVLRRDYFLRRITQHPLAPEMATRPPFRPRRGAGGAAAAQAVPTDRGAQRPEAQAAGRRRGASRVSPHRSRNSLSGGPLIGHWPDSLAA